MISGIVTTSGQNGVNFDFFGDYLPVIFAGIVYTDTNGSGVYTNSASDPALVGVTLTLTGTDGLGHPVNATTTTGAGGAYSFGTLRPGTYTVTETVPATYTASAANVGKVGASSVGTAASSIQITSIAMTSGQAGINYNFGDYQAVGFSGIAYTDTNGSGVYTNSASDPALVGVTLTLSGTDGLGHPVNATTTTGAGGAYSFGTLRPGTYIVTETVPSTYTASAANVGSLGGTAASTTQISAIALTSGQAGSNYNFGEFQNVSFGGIVYTDTHGSGVYTNSRQRSRPRRRHADLERHRRPRPSGQRHHHERRRRRVQLRRPAARHLHRHRDRPRHLYRQRRQCRYRRRLVRRHGGVHHPDQLHRPDFRPSRQ